ncbi:hypothetical protein [Burkholderia ubonensis]|uniref:hypothetical protein n=1 Tax=Burkholderia ubonensis TaxID=101571 RepID=UPI0012F931A2|nr:hypothetical protein [Burkholderia ubonensis]
MKGYASRFPGAEPFLLGGLPALLIVSAVHHGDVFERESRTKETIYTEFADPRGGYGTTIQTDASRTFTISASRKY